MCVGGGEGQRSEEDEDVGGENYKRWMSLCVWGERDSGRRMRMWGDNGLRRMSRGRDPSPYTLILAPQPVGTVRLGARMSVCVCVWEAVRRMSVWRGRRRRGGAAEDGS